MLNTIYNHSCESMHELPDESVHLMITSPPYNVGKEYEQDLTLDEYRTMLRRVWKETMRVLVDGGRACVNLVGINRCPYTPLHYYTGIDMIDIGFLMRGEIIWHKNPTTSSLSARGTWDSARNPVLHDVHETIMVFSKGNYSRGEGVSTIPHDDYKNHTFTIWYINSEFASRIGHPAPFPVELPYRLIQLYSFENDIILDPFMGSGTTAVAAKQTNRRWVGYEKEAKYIELAQGRLSQEYLF